MTVKASQIASTARRSGDVYQPRKYSCRCCGTEIVLDVYRKGRKPEYCSASCRDVMKFWNAFNRKFDQLNLTDEKRSLWSGEFFRLRNQLGNSKKGAL